MAEAIPVPPAAAAITPAAAINDNTEDGIYVLGSGLRTVEYNDITSNGFSGRGNRDRRQPHRAPHRINGNRRKAIEVYTAGVWWKIMT